MRRKSKKRQALDAKRRAFVAEQLEAREVCEAGEIIGTHLRGDPPTALTYRWAECTYSALMLHEPLTRARAPGPETILSEENSVAICFNCHRWVHDHVGLSEQLGLLIRSTATR